MTITTRGRSASLSHDSLTDVPADKQIRCLRDWMVVEPLEVVHSHVLLVIDNTRPVRGIVKAVGPGCYPKRYDHPEKHKRTKMWSSKSFRPTEVKVGDVVELGGADLGGYAFQTFRWGDVTHILCREEDVSGVEIQPCIGGDATCPCVDGMACHYRDAPDGTKAWPIPERDVATDDCKLLEQLVERELWQMLDSPDLASGYKSAA